MPRRPDADAGSLLRVVQRAFPRQSVRLERTVEGVSSLMYRADVANGGTFYVRVGDDAAFDLTVDAAILDVVRLEGARVPEVVHVERAPELDRWVLIMRAIPGVPLGAVADPAVAAGAARDAGRSAAIMNAVDVDGFGWVERDAGRRIPSATFETYADFAAEHLPDDRDELGRLLHGLFEEDELDQLWEITMAERRRAVAVASLAHGDLDVTAILVDGGSFAGIIDFSELRGASPDFDLAHFLLHDQESNPIPLFAAFREGYEEASSAPVDLGRVRTTAVFVGLRQLAGWEGRGAPRSWFTAFRAAQLENLLEGRPACAPRKP